MDLNLIMFYTIGGGAILITGIFGYLLASRYKIRAGVWLLYTLMGLLIYIFFAQYFKYQSLNFYVDFSHWLQILRSMYETGMPLSRSVEFIVPNGYNFFSIHFIPLLYLIGIPFFFVPSVITIIATNWLLMISSGIPLYLIAKKYGNKIFSLFTVILLFWYPTFQYITIYEFEMLRFSIPILLWMLYFWEKRKIGLYFLFVMLAVLVREEVGLTVAMFGVYLLWKERQRKIGIATILLGLSAFLIITQWVMPAFRAGEFTHVATYWFSQFGNTPIEILKGAITHPLLLAKSVFNPIKLANIGMLFAPLLFLPLVAPAALISIIANIGIGLLSGAPEHTSYMLYYISPSVPFIFYAFLKAWPKITVRFNTQAVMSAMFVGIIVSNIFFGPSPISLQFWFKDLRPAPFRTQNFHWSVYQVTDHHKKVNEFVGLIPDEAIVSAEQFLTPRLYNKKGTMIFPQLESVDGKYKAEYVFIDKTNPLKTGVNTVPGSWDGLRQNPQMYYDLVEKDPLQWELIKTDDGYELYKRRL